jgi:hypothetical protein
MDKTLNVWDQSNIGANPVESYKLPHCAKSIDFHNGKIVVGTRDGRIIKIENG